MTEPVAVKTRAVSLASLEGLKKRVGRILLAASRQIEAAKIRAYWDTGRAINEHLRLNGGRAEYGAKALLELAESVGQGVSVLEQCARFAQKFPDFKIVYTCTQWPSRQRQSSKAKAPAPLFWSHFRALLSVENDAERMDLTRQAFEKGWTVDELEARIHARRISEKSADSFVRKGKGGKSRAGNFLKPRIGVLDTYQVVSNSEFDLAESAELFLDHGFRFYSRIQTPGLKAGQVVEVREGNLKPSGRRDQDRYFYRAVVEKPIDGDTFWALIDIGMGHKSEQKIRLRGIDAPEIALREGKKSARFVKALLTPGLEILIRTTPSPTYDRFEADGYLDWGEAEGRVKMQMEKEGIDPGVLDPSSPVFFPGIPSAASKCIFLNNLLPALGLARFVRG